MKEKIREALDKATPGPWNKEGVEVWRRGTGYNVSEDAHIWICDAFDGDNAHLIANSPTFLNWSLERIEQLEKALEMNIELATLELDYEGSLRILSQIAAFSQTALGREE